MSWFQRSGKVLYKGHGQLLAVSVEHIQKIDLMAGVDVDTNQFGTPSLADQLLLR